MAGKIKRILAILLVITLLAALLPIATFAVENKSFLEMLASAESGSTISLQTDVTAEDLILPAGVNIDLNGCTLTVDSVLSYASSGIVDTSENATGLLKINDADGNMISGNNVQLPVYDHAAGGYRFFNMELIPCAITGENSDTPKVWFKIQTEKFDGLYRLICTGSDMQIMVKLAIDGQSEETYAIADLAFTKIWADSYLANENVYVTVTMENLQNVKTVFVTPCVVANGVEVESPDGISVSGKLEEEPVSYPYNITYAEYLAMSETQQMEFYNCFQNHSDFKAWWEAAKKFYEDNKVEIEIGPDGTIDLGGLNGGKK